MNRRFVARRRMPDPIEMLMFLSKGPVYDVWDTHKRKVAHGKIYSEPEQAERIAYKMENDWLRKNL